jgi:hypothetical protein
MVFDVVFDSIFDGLWKSLCAIYRLKGMYFCEVCDQFIEKRKYSAKNQMCFKCLRLEKEVGLK